VGLLRDRRSFRARYRRGVSIIFNNTAHETGDDKTASQCCEICESVFTGVFLRASERNDTCFIVGMDEYSFRPGAVSGDGRDQLPFAEITEYPMISSGWGGPARKRAEHDRQKSAN